jgi:EAL domain-containing protein (putative c-di-GMP-specific phosphodiesterase class I)
VIRLDRWVLEEVIRQHGQWQSLGSPLAELSVSVNLDAGILEQRVFDGRPLDRFLRQQDVPLDWLTLEIEVSGLLAKGQEHRHLLKRLEQLGITLVADDLGRVPIDFIQLAMLPFASAKIGRHLTAQLTGKGPIELSLAALRQCLSALGISVVLVGVETESQRDAALAMGFDAMQGNLFSAPLREADLSHWVTTSGK